MPVDLQKYLVVGISSRALFDLSEEDELFRTQGLGAYRAYQIEHESRILKPGAGFALIQTLLKLNTLLPERVFEVIIMSRNSSETSLRIFNSIEQYNLDITRAALSGGAPLAPYLRAYQVNLFLSMYQDDVERGLQSGIASALLYKQPAHPMRELEQIRIAFDGDAVIFSDESEKIYQQKGLEAFVAHERNNAKKPLPAGPFAPLLKALSYVQNASERGRELIRTALVTARNSPAHERVIRTLSAWEVDVNECFFLGGAPKTAVLEAFEPHIYFDDQPVHCEPASQKVPTGRVVSRGEEKSSDTE